MTAGNFWLGSLRAVEGAKFAVAVKAIAGFGKRIYYRLGGEINKSDVKGSNLSGSVRLDKKLEATVVIEFVDDGKKERSERASIQISTDKSFRDSSRVLIPKSGNSHFHVHDAPKRKSDLITGVQDVNTFGRKVDSFTLGLLSNSASSKYGAYFAQFKPDLSAIDLYGDTNMNGKFDRKDKRLGALKINLLKDFGQFKEGVPRTFKYNQNKGIFSLEYGRQTYLEASGSENLF